MARPIQQTINCPQCGQPFNAILEQILDVGVDPSARDRLLSGRVNLVSCSHCGFQGMISTPLMYHDPEKKLALVFVPMELNLSKEDRERMIGDMTNAVMRAMPEDAPRGYLLQPKTALTMQGLVDQVLEAEGITKEMIDAERRKVTLIDDLIKAKSDEVDGLLEENAELLDMTFLQLLSTAAQAASQAGENRQSLRLLNVRSKLMETTEAGRELRQREEALVEASNELQALGDSLTREKFIDLLVEAAGNEAKLDAFATLGQGLLDYSTFQALSERIDKTENEEQKQALTEARERLLAYAAQVEEQSRAVIEQAVATLRTLLQAQDIPSAIQANLQRIDQTFLEVLQANLDEARRSGQVELSSRLKEIRDEVMRLVQESAPPEIRLINDLLSAETEQESLDLLHDRQGEINEDIVAVMGELSDQLREAGNEAAAQRLDAIRAEAEKMI